MPAVDEMFVEYELYEAVLKLFVKIVYVLL
jgi:hypothetical protein